MYRATRPVPAYTLQRRQLYANLSAQLELHGLSAGELTVRGQLAGGVSTPASLPTTTCTVAFLHAAPASLDAPGCRGLPQAAKAITACMRAASHALKQQLSLGRRQSAPAHSWPKLAGKPSAGSDFCEWQSH